MYQIYGLFDPEFPNDIRYVGCTFSTLTTRLSRHKTQQQGLVGLWIKGLLSENRQPMIRLLEKPAAEDAFERELFWIKALTPSGRLLNCWDDASKKLLVAKRMQLKQIKKYDFSSSEFHA